jgi:hypothetical protein
MSEKTNPSHWTQLLLINPTKQILPLQDASRAGTQNNVFCFLEYKMTREAQEAANTKRNKQSLEVL